MEPIINPLFIFLLNKVNGLLGVIVFACVITGVFYFILLIMKLSGAFESSDSEEERCSKILKVLLSVFLISLMLSFAIPNRKTIIQMTIAKNITTENIEKAIGVGIDIKESIKLDVFDIIEKIKE